jgi:hypothetical protein
MSQATDSRHSIERLPHYVADYRAMRGSGIFPRQRKSGLVEPTSTDKATQVSESTDSTGFWRIFFWLSFALGTLILVLSGLLAQVPRPHHADLRLDLTVRFCVVVLMAGSIFIAKRIRKIDEAIPISGRASAMQVVLLIAWCELIVALLGTIAIAVSNN